MIYGKQGCRFKCVRSLVKNILSSSLRLNLRRISYRFDRNDICSPRVQMMLLSVYHPVVGELTRGELALYRFDSVEDVT